jgi:hypothetical protein
MSMMIGCMESGRNLSFSFYPSLGRSESEQLSYHQGERGLTIVKHRGFEI